MLYMERTVTWDALQKEILEKMRHLLRPGVYIQVQRVKQQDSFLFSYLSISPQLLKVPE